MTDANGNIIATSEIIAGNHNDSYQIVERLKQLLSQVRALNIPLAGAYFNADSSFDTKAVRKLLWNRRLRPNIPENKRNRKRPKRGRKRLFNPEIYKKRFASERTFAWIDKFRRLLIRFERKSVYFLGFHLIAYTLINLRELLAKV